MPKKTKREKILAEEHRKINEPESPLYAFQATPKSMQSVSMEDVTEYRAIKMDLVKTLVLAATAISVELMLYLKMGR